MHGKAEPPPSTIPGERTCGSSPPSSPPASNMPPAPPGPGSSYCRVAATSQARLGRLGLWAWLPGRRRRRSSTQQRAGGSTARALGCTQQRAGGGAAPPSSGPPLHRQSSRRSIHPRCDLFHPVRRPRSRTRRAAVPRRRCCLRLRVKPQAAAVSRVASWGGGTAGRAPSKACLAPPLAPETREGARSLAPPPAASCRLAWLSPSDSKGGSSSAMAPHGWVPVTCVARQCAAAAVGHDRACRRRVAE